MEKSRVDTKIEELIDKIEEDPHVELGFYEELAFVYEFLYGTAYNYKGQSEMIRDHQDKASRILDVGCGTGSLVEQLSKGYNDAKVEGIDLHKGMLGVAREKFGNKKKADFLHQDFFNIEADSIYDIITGFGVNPHFSESEHRDFFRKSGQMLVKGGLLVFDYKDPGYEVNGRFNPWEKETSKYRVTSRFTTVYKDDQSYYAVSYEFEDKQSGEVYTTGCLIEIYFHSPERLRKQLEEEGFEILELYTEDVDQSGVFVAEKR